MGRILGGKWSRSHGGLFRRLVLPIVLVALVTAFVAFFQAGSVEKRRDHERLKSVVEANGRLMERLNLPMTDRMRENLSEIAGVVFLFCQDGKVIGDEEVMADIALDKVGEVVEEGEHLVFATELKDERFLIGYQPVVRRAHFPPAVLIGVIVALGTAFFISRSVVLPLGKIAKEVREVSSGEALLLPQSVRERRDEIGVLARSLEENRDRLIDEQEKRQAAEKMAMLGRLTTSLAHEIKNPAASLIMHGQTLRKVEGNPVGRLIEEEGERITSLVEQWLFVAKPEGFDGGEYDLVALLSDLIGKLRPLCDFYQVSVVQSFPINLVVRCDWVRLEHVFRNLIQNGLQAMPDGGELKIFLREREDEIEFEVRDQGGGFSASALEKFGEAFYSEREGGMGLGLTLVKEVVEAHGGRVEAENAIGGGAVVRGVLPGFCGRGRSMNNGRLLIVEDNRSLGIAVSVLAERCGLEVTVVPTLARAREALRVGKGVDLLVLDIGLPDGHGLELLKDGLVASGVPIAVMSAHGELENAIEARKLGVNHFFDKPIDFDLMEGFLREFGRARVEKQKADSEGVGVSSAPFIGASAKMRPVFQQIAQACASDVPVVVRGEVGTGRSHVGRLIQSNTKPDQSGEFVGTRQTEGGELGDFLRKFVDGVILLRNVAVLPLDSQKELLVVLDELGERAPRLMVTVDEEGLHQGVMLGEFHADLYYRLQVMEIHLPPLRERLDDLEALASYFLGELDTTMARELSQGLVVILKGHLWPGNLRELRNLLSYLLVAQSGAPVLSEEFLPEHFGGSGEEEKVAVEELDVVIERWVDEYFDSREEYSYRDLMGMLEGKVLSHLLRRFDGKQSHLAQAMALNRSTLRKKLNDLLR